MRKIVLFALALAAIVTAIPAWAQGDGPEFKVTGEVRARWEYFENLADFTDHDNSGDVDDDSYDLWPYRVRVGINGQFTNNVRAYVEFQGHGYFGNDWPEKTSQDPNFQAIDNGDADDINLYQGFVEMSEIGGSKFRLRLGRQEMPVGNELLIGASDFYNGTSFDGALLTWDGDKLDVNAFYFNVFEANAGCVSGCGDDNVLLGGVTVPFGIGEMGDIEPYAIVYHDGDAFGDRFNTYGARWTRKPSEDKAFDWNIEAAMQEGDVAPNVLDESLSASVFEGWFGWGFGNERRHRVHLGYYMSSGDADPLDSDDESFRPLFQDAWSNNRLGDADVVNGIQGGLYGGLAGVTDLNLGWQYRGEKNTFRASIHDFTLTEDFGGEDALGMEIDAAWGHQYNEHLGFQVGLGYFEPDDAIGTDADPGMRLYAQSRLRW